LNVSELNHEALNNMNFRVAEKVCSHRMINQWHFKVAFSIIPSSKPSYQT